MHWWFPSLLSVTTAQHASTHTCTCAHWLRPRNAALPLMSMKFEWPKFRFIDAEISKSCWEADSILIWLCFVYWIQPWYFCGDIRNTHPHVHVLHTYFTKWTSHTYSLLNFIMLIDIFVLCNQQLRYLQKNDIILLSLLDELKLYYM